RKQGRVSRRCSLAQGGGTSRSVARRRVARAQVPGPPAGQAVPERAISAVVGEPSSNGPRWGRNVGVGQKGDYAHIAAAFRAYQNIDLKDALEKLSPRESWSPGWRRRDGERRKWVWRWG